MLFPTATFAIFFLIVLPLSWLTMPKVHRWRPFILVASYVFYGWWDWRFIFLLSAAPSGIRCSPSASHRATAQAQKKALLDDRPGREPRRARLLQVLRLLRRLVDAWRRSWACDLPRSSEVDHPAGRHLVLHVPGDQLRHRHLSRRHRADDARDVRCLPLVLPAPRGRADRAGGEFLPQIRRRASTRGGSTPAEAFWLISLGLFKKVVIASYLASHVVDPLFGSPRQHAGARGALRRLRLRHPDLRRLLGLHRHRHRLGAPARDSSSRRTSTRPTPRRRCRTSGDAGT